MVLGLGCRVLGKGVQNAPAKADDQIWDEPTLNAAAVTAGIEGSPGDLRV